MRSSQQLRHDLIAIWRAGVQAVRGDTLVAHHVAAKPDGLYLGSHCLKWGAFDRLCVVGAGKAAAGMAVGLEESLGPDVMRQKQLSGWVNVPADCLSPTRRIHLHPARLAGRNEPTPEAVAGTEEILQRVAGLGPRDVCVALITGGGSALLPAPVSPITLDDKLRVTKLLSAAGAEIHQLNTVRKQLSRIKGGGLARACQAGRLFALIISDVLGDPLDVIASGPTVVDSSTPQDALQVLRKFAPQRGDVPGSVWQFLERKASRDCQETDPPDNRVEHLVLGNNQVALEACAAAARQLGWDVEIASTDPHEPTAEEVGRRMALRALRLKQASGSQCWISGGEPVVELAPEAIRGTGGRNQQLVLAALDQLCRVEDREVSAHPAAGVAMISGGTDGEDGPTDAAGGLIWPDLIQSISASHLELKRFLQRNDAYHLLGPLGALLRTGPTQTNVCDVRILLVN